MTMDATLAVSPEHHVLMREMALAEAVKEVATELRLVDVGDLIAFVRMGQLANIQDLVDSSVELFFKPGALTYAWAADLEVSWTTPPIIFLDLEFRHLAVTVFFSLALRPGSASVQIHDVRFERPSDDPELNTRQLVDAIADARLDGPSRP
jgi:hypothetical protein